MTIVVDSSITVAWYLDDESTEQTDEVLRRVAAEGGVVPLLWRFEVGNAFQMAVRRNRIDAAYRDRVLMQLATLCIVADQESDAHAWSTSILIAERHRLTLYDAAYFELAQRRRLELATLDVALAKAARAEHIAVIGD